LDLTRPLVGSVSREDGRGVLARLRMWTCTPPATAAQAGPLLVRAPGAALLRLEVQFTRGLDRVQVLIGRVLMPRARMLPGTWLR